MAYTCWCRTRVNTKQQPEREQINTMRRIFVGGAAELCFECAALGVQAYRRAVTGSNGRVRAVEGVF